MGWILVAFYANRFSLILDVERGHIRCELDSDILR
jgi:hypothetical protein